MKYARYNLCRTHYTPLAYIKKYLRGNLYRSYIIR